MATNDGGPAFEANNIVGSLRDDLAAKVMLVTVGDVIREIGAGKEDPVDGIRRMCKCAYGIADAMLAAREAKP